MQVFSSVVHPAQMLATIVQKYSPDNPAYRYTTSGFAYSAHAREYCGGHAKTHFLHVFLIHMFLAITLGIVL